MFLWISDLCKQNIFYAVEKYLINSHVLRASASHLNYKRVGLLFCASHSDFVSRVDYRWKIAYEKLYWNKQKNHEDYQFQNPNHHVHRSCRVVRRLPASVCKAPTQTGSNIVSFFSLKFYLMQKVDFFHKSLAKGVI